MSVVWISNAQWALTVYRGMDGKGISTDTHRTREEAQAVCEALRREGFGGMRAHFPLRTWVSFEGVVDMAENTVDSIPDSELVMRAIRALRPTVHQPLWVIVMATFCLGSTYAHQLCQRHGLNPDATSRTDMALAKAAEADRG